eukprot:scaffold73365_cov59-Cyclotella_meneghiniana.AAC.2
MQPGPYVSHAKACLEAGGGKEDASTDTPRIWGHVKDLEDIRGEENRKKVFVMKRWMGSEYKTAYLVHPSVRLSGMCMIEDCCWVGHLNAMGRHMESQHKTAPNNESYIGLKECAVISVTREVGIDGQAVAPKGEEGGEGGGKATEVTDGGRKPRAEKTSSKKQKSNGKKKTMLGGLRVEEMTGEVTGKRKRNIRQMVDA